MLLLVLQNFPALPHSSPVAPAAPKRKGPLASAVAARPASGVIRAWGAVVKERTPRKRRTAKPPPQIGAPELPAQLLQQQQQQQPQSQSQPQPQSQPQQQQQQQQQQRQQPVLVCAHSSHGMTDIWAGSFLYYLTLIGTPRRGSELSLGH